MKRKFITRLLALCMCVVIIGGNSMNRACVFDDISEPVAAILCAVESKDWYIAQNSSAWKNCGCLLGKKRCDSVLSVPTEAQVPASPHPPMSKNKQYQLLAEKAETKVPQTWWRKGFANDLLLLSHNDNELPRKQFDASRIRNKKLKNMLQCVTRQQFIRKSFSFQDAPLEGTQKCTAMNEVSVKTFFTLWKQEYTTIGGNLVLKNGNRYWTPKSSDNGALLVSAMEVLDHFYTNYGGVWTGCFKLEKDVACRGALAAAAQVASMHMISDFADKRKEFSESSFVAGYMLASLGRGLLHGDSDTTGDRPVTVWKVRCADFTALQAAYMKLYIDSFGKTYSKQLNSYIPMAFMPDFEVQPKQQWKHLSQGLEPIYTSLRNWMFTESANLIDFSPYRPLVAEQDVRNELIPSQSQSQSQAQAPPTRRRVLIDVGANGFFASPKALLDNYAPYIPFTHAIMIEPEPHFSATVPPVYSQRYNISFLQIYVEVATDSATDIVRMLPDLVTKEDFVVLKFDVDPNRFAQGPTMEWGFLFSLTQNPEVLQLIDELYIELHFHFPSLYWYHYHSNWEALDAFRYLRSKGLIIHSWP